MNADGAAMDGTGKIGDAKVAEHWQLSPADNEVSGHIGADAEKFSLSGPVDTTTDGTVGTVSVHQRLKFVDDEDNPHESLDGTVGDTALHLDITHPISQAFWPGAVHAEGNFGPAHVVLDQQTTRVGDNSFTVAGQGTLGATPLSWSLDVIEDKPPASPPPSGS